MRKIILAIFLLKSIFINGQSNLIIADSISIHGCKTVLTTEYTKKFEVINKNISSTTNAQKNIIKGIYNEIQDDFWGKIKRNNFICDDNINPYLQVLMEEVLTKNGIDTKPYRILLSRDSDANAYNTGDGTIVIHFGLFLTVENEDELVFVISHEIGHQYLSHVKKDIESFAKLSTSSEIVKKTREIRNQKYGKATMADDLLKKIRYQNYNIRRKKEFEADSIGRIFYKKTLRNPKAMVTILEKLDSSDTEKDSLTIADYKLIFENNGFKVKERYFEQEESLFKAYDNEKRIAVDSLKSHPDCAARIKKISRDLENKFLGSLNTSKNFLEIKENSIYQNLFN